MNNNTLENIDEKLLQETSELEKIVTENEISKKCLEDDLLLFQISWALDLRDKVDKEAVELKMRQSKFEYVHGVLREIGNLATEKNELDLTHHPELQEKLRVIRDEMGIAILADHKKFSPHQTANLVANLNSATEDWDMLNQAQLRTVTSLTTELLQSYSYIKQVMNMLDRPKRRAIDGIAK